MTHRTPWEALGPEAEADIAVELGAPITAVTPVSGGFSPAVAASVALADGRKVFIKAITPEINAETVEMMELEARVVAQIHDQVYTPKLQFAGHIHGWYVLAFDHVDARHIDDPFALLGALDEYADAVDGVAVEGVVRAEKALAGVFGNWAGTVAGPSAFVHLAELERGWETLVAGSGLLHLDARIDNVLIDESGVVWIVDWANACIGAPWIDAAAVIPSLAHTFGVPVQELVGASRLLQAVQRDALMPVVAGLAGYFAVGSLRPAPPGMPTVRAFQRAQAEPALDWLRALVGPSVHVPTMDEVERTVGSGSMGMSLSD